MMKEGEAKPSFARYFQLSPKNYGVPWQRVINSQGRISIINPEHTGNEQAELLRAEGVVVSDDLRVDLDVYLWQGLHWLEIDDILQEGQ